MSGQQPPPQPDDPNQPQQPVPPQQPMQPPQPPPPPQASYGAPPAYGAPMQQVPSTSTMAIIALIASITGVLCVLPFIGSIVGLVLASMAKKEIAASNGYKTGSSLVTWAKILGWIGLVLAVLGVAFWILFVVVLAANTTCHYDAYGYYVCN